MNDRDSLTRRVAPYLAAGGLTMRRSGLVGLLLLCLIAAGSLVAGIASAQCFTCSQDGGCVDGFSRTGCMSTYANGVWVCSFSGDYCVGGPGGGCCRDGGRAVPAEDARVTAHLLYSLPREAWRGLFPAERPVRLDLAGRSIAQAGAVLAAFAGLKESDLLMVGAVLRYGNPAGEAPVFGIPGAGPLTIEVERTGSRLARVRLRGTHAPGGAWDGAIDGPGAALVVPVVAGERHYALVIWSTVASLTREANTSFRREVGAAMSSAPKETELSIVGKDESSLKSWGALKLTYR